MHTDTTANSSPLLTTIPSPTPYAIETQRLTKTYGTRTVVDSLTLAIPAGQITGFIGHNGAGKTTTLRMLLGLITPTSGSGKVLGHDLARSSAYLHRVGALIEGPAFHPTLSATDNLRVLTNVARISDDRIVEVLEIVDLAARADDKLKSFSLGMKQRLGLAAALLPDPSLLILDEPTNGLDPQCDPKSSSSPIVAWLWVLAVPPPRSHCSAPRFPTSLARPVVEVVGHSQRQAVPTLG